MQDTKYLSVVALGPSQTAFLEEIIRLTAQHNCYIANSHFVRQGAHYSFNVLLSGSWSSIAKMEASLLGLGQKLSINIHLQRVDIINSPVAAVPYVIYIATLNDPNAIHYLIQFFNQEEVIIHEIFTETYLARQTQASMLSITMRIHIPTNLSVADFRERFMLYCDDVNLDAMMEPEKS